jgi:hypothetical protein
MSQHHFDIDFAKEYGIEESIFINNIDFWLHKNKSANKNYYFGLYWTKFTVDELLKYFPYLSESKMKYALSNLIKKEILINRQFDKDKWDRTNYYTFNPDFVLKRKGKFTYSIDENYALDYVKLPLIKDNIINKDNKDIIINNNISDSVESEKPSLKKSLENNIKNHLPKEKPKLSYEKIDRFLKKLLNELWNELIILHPKIKKENFLNETELYYSNLYLNYIRKGIPIGKFSSIYEESFYKKYKVPIEKIKQGHADGEIYKLFKNVLNMYRLGYFPFDDKSKLPSRLSILLLCPKSPSRSHLLRYGYNPPQYDEVRIKLKKDNHPEQTKLIKKNLLFELTIKQENELIDRVENLYGYSRSLCEDYIVCKYNNKKYTRQELDHGYFQQRVVSFNGFIDCYICFLNEKKQNWNEFNIFIGSFKIGSITWNEFKEYMSSCDCPITDIDLSWYMNRKEQEMIKSGELVIPEKTIQEQIRELEIDIANASEGSANHDMFSERLVELKQLVK